ncbi:acyl carrier protein [Paenibacillus motobuensis]|uniref:Carrier domain-containing protein n=1 Tax=Paenibacillus motobuensis TaxID=295324 RepID=A0ABN0XVB9_9BACL
MKDELRSRVCAVMAEVLQIHGSCNVNIIRGNTEQWDSLKHLELILALEEEFQVRFTAEQAVNIHSLEDIVTILGGS